MSEIHKREPTTPAKHVGIEIEFDLPQGVTLEQVQTRITKRGLDPYVETYRENIGPTMWERIMAYELTILDTQAHYLKTLNRVLRILRNVGAIVDQRCGLHVHVDARQDNPYRMEERLSANRERLLDLCAPHRRTNTYTWGRGIIPLREGYQTVEVRYMDGNFVFKRIKRYIQTLLRIAYA